MTLEGLLAQILRRWDPDAADELLMRAASDDGSEQSEETTDDDEKVLPRPSFADTLTRNTSGGKGKDKNKGKGKKNCRYFHGKGCCPFEENCRFAH